MPRIHGQPIPACFPASGAVPLLLFGEAPGPRGADQSGIPFWGDGAGLAVYRALAATGLAEVPDAAWADWDGARLKAQGLVPILRGVALSNAWPACPTRDGDRFRAPTDRELRSPGNLDRLAGELARAAATLPAGGRLRVLAFGTRPRWILERLAALAPGSPAFDLHPLPHPSAQGLLQAAPGKGKGLKLEDLRQAWEASLRNLLGPLNIS
jgi:uracil-DNA glycosylase